MTTLNRPNHLGFCNEDSFLYYQKSKLESKSDAALPEISYRYQTEQKIQTVAERIFSCLYTIITCPYRALQWLASKLIVPASNYPLSTCTQCRVESDLFMRNLGQVRLPIHNSQWKYKRISVDVDGMTIDAMLIVKDSTAQNGKWILSSNGNRVIYEINKRLITDTKHLAFSLGANALVFNYPGVGASQGTLCPKTIAKTYKAMLRFLEDKQAGIGADTIIGYGYSLGGAAQALGVDSHEFDPNINYVFIKDRTFSTLSKVASDILGSWTGKLIEFLGWNMDVEASSKKLNTYEIILQCADTGSCGETRICDDGVISARASLAQSFIRNETKELIPLLNKAHTDPFSRNELLHLTGVVERSVEKQISDRAVQAQAG